jgi:tetratricopeptide (TPR) repeat protein
VVLLPFSSSARAQVESAAAQTDDATGFLAAAERLLAGGKLAEAERLALDRPERDQAAQFVRARLATIRGRYDEAESLLRGLAARQPQGDAVLELGLLYSLLGRRSQAMNTLEPIVDARTAAETTEDLMRAARAAQTLGRFRAANGLFREAAGTAADDPRLNTAWGDLLLEKYNLREAIKSYEAALEVDPEYAPAHLGLARALADENPPAAAQRARQALALNPTLVGAHALLAALALDNNRREEASAELTQALAINPNHLESLSLKAALAYMEGRSADFDTDVHRVLTINPVYGEVYRMTSAQVAAAYRFEEAAGLARKALQVDPDNTRARAELGVHLLRTGDESEARSALEESFAQDPFDVVTYNLLGLLDTLQNFETFTDGNLVIRLHPDDAPIMRELIVPLAHQALEALAGRYEFAPKGPVLIEMFPRHDDFAVRNVGLPGMVGALGACFGRVVTLDSPRARPPGSFNWAGTLWHELAHVITLQMSDQRLPRWLSEGISVYEERRARSHWGREADFAFDQALARRDVLPLATLNTGFSDPRSIALAYHQASLVVEMIVERWGQPTLNAMVRSYSAGLDDDQVLARVLKIEPAVFQSSFDEFLERRFGSVRAALELPDELARELGTAQPDELNRLVDEHPDKYALQMAVGRARLAANDTAGAAAAFERAAELVPDVTGSESPRAWLAQLAETNGDPVAAMAELERLLSRDNTGVDQARDLARLATAAGDRTLLRLAHARIVEVMPFEADSHAELGRLALAEQDAATATSCFRRALAAGSADPVAVRTELAESLLMTGQTADAKREVIAALEMAPRFERAQELLLRIVDGRAQQEP